MRCLAILAGAILVTGCFHHSPEPKATAVAAEAPCAAFGQRAAASPGTARHFGNVADGVAPGGAEWREFSSDHERSAAGTHDNLNEVADVWMFPAEGALVHFVFTSPSTDWADYVDYCFRSDGTLAAVDAELRTFKGNMIVNRRSLFDAAGRESEGPTSYRDLQTKQPTDANGPQGGGYQDHAFPLYTAMSALPFWELLAAPRQPPAPR